MHQPHESAKERKTPAHRKASTDLHTIPSVRFSHSVHTGVPLTLQAACLGSLIMLHD